MLCKVKFFKPATNSYGGAAYTYRTTLTLRVGHKVLAPTAKGDENKALVVEVDCPESVIDPAWADRVLRITKLDYPKDEGETKNDERS